MKGKILAVFAVAAVALCACTSKTVFDYGRFENGVYTNDFFGITAPLPEGWEVKTREQINDLQEIGYDVMIENKQKRKELQKIVDIQTAVLFMAQHTDSASASSSSIQLSAENLKAFPQLKDGRQYLVEAVKGFDTYGLSYRGRTDDIKEKTVGGVPFYYVDIELLLPDGASVFQRIYSGLHEKSRFALLFHLTYNHSFQLERMEDILDAVKFS